MRLSVSLQSVHPARRPPIRQKAPGDAPGFAYAVQNDEAVFRTGRDGVVKNGRLNILAELMKTGCFSAIICLGSLETHSSKYRATRPR